MVGFKAGTQPQPYESTEANLGQDSLAGEKLCAKADDETEHGETAIPSFSKIYESKAGCVVRHVKLRYPHIVTNRSDLLTVPLDTFIAIRQPAQGRAFLFAVGSASAGSSGHGCFG